MSTLDRTEIKNIQKKKPPKKNGKYDGKMENTDEKNKSTEDIIRRF